MSEGLFGRIDREIFRAIFAIIGLTIYGKILSDMAQLYITGHTTNFLWFAGDMGSPQSPGPYNLIGFTMIAVMGFANLHVWSKIFNYYYRKADKHLGPYFQLLVNKLATKWTNHLEFHMNKVNVAGSWSARYSRFCAWQSRQMESLGRGLARERRESQKRRIARLQNTIRDARRELRELP